MTIRRLLVALVAAVLLAVVLPAPSAGAKSSYISRTTGTSADAWWTQIDNTPVGSSPFGNVHVGWLYAYQTTNGVGDAFLYIDDFDCEAGQQPHFGHGEEGGCTYIGSRSGEGFGLELTIDRRLGSATLKGRVTLYGGNPHDDPHAGPGAPVGSPMIDMSWQGVGNVSKSVSTFRWSDGGSQFTERYRSSYRSASLDGTIGVMTFDDELSGGSISSFSMQSKGRSR